MRTTEETTPVNKEPQNKNTYIIDTIFFLQTLPELPVTFDGIAKVVLQHSCSFSQDVHTVSDAYREGPSIKRYKRDESGNYNMSYIITGPSQRRPSNFNAALLSASFKKALLVFLKNEWTSNKYVPTLEGQKAYFTLEESCYLYTAKDGHVERSEVADLQSSHEEADTRVIFHAKYISEKSLLPVIVI